MKKARTTCWSPGHRWTCINDQYGSFDFVVVGPGSKPDRKIFNLEYHEEYWAKRNGPDVTQNREFTHKHVKKYATYKGVK